MFCNSLLEIHLQMKITVHQNVSETGNKKTQLHKKVQPPKGRRRHWTWTSDWRYCGGWKQKSVIIRTVIQLPIWYKCSRTFSWRHTQACTYRTHRTVWSHTHSPQHKNHIALHIPTVSPPSVIQIKFTDHDGIRPVMVPSQRSWTSIFRISTLHKIIHFNTAV